ncbi:hypothetical protein D3C73_886840 [compost metagenome]
MKCTEVIEWMHRYLDHDLSPEETVEMYRHIDNCPSCAEVFDRLTMLSEQLEQLPDVKPPFSLVDSILPQLEKIDPVIQSASAEESEDNKIIPMTRKSAQGKAAAKNSRWTSMAARTGIGAVAAAVILLVAVLNMPGSMPAADVENSLKQSADTADMARSSEAMSKMATENPDGAAADSSNQATVPAETGVQFSEQTDAGFGAMEATPVPDASTAAPAAGDTAPAVTDKPVSTKQSAPVTRYSEPATPAPAAGTATGSGNNSADTSAADTGALNSGGNAADSAAAPQEDQLPPEERAGVMSLLPTLVAAQGSWSSPDGRYAAELAGQQLVIYSLPSSGAVEDRTALTSLPLNGAWVSGTWSADSLQFTYVTMQNGAEVAEVYAVPSAEATPSPSTPADASASASPANK